MPFFFCFVMFPLYEKLDKRRSLQSPGQFPHQPFLMRRIRAHQRILRGLAGFLLNFWLFFNSDILPQYVHLFAHNSDNQIACFDGNTIFYSKTGSVSLWDICWTDGIAEDGTLNTAMGTSAASVIAEKMKTVIQGERRQLFHDRQMDHPFIVPSPEAKEAVAKYGTTGVMVRFINCVAKALQDWTDTKLSGRRVEYRRVCLFVFLFRPGQRK